MSKLPQRTETLSFLLQTASTDDIREAYNTLCELGSQNPSRSSALEAVASIIRDRHPDVIETTRMAPGS